jgi:cytoskeletal protein RodZ
MAAAVSDSSGKGSSSPAGTPPDDSARIGERLRVARERLGLTLEQVSRETRIPRRHLEAIEQGNLAALPGPFYQRAQTRTYARAVHLNPDVLVASVKRGLPQSTVADAPPELPQVHPSTRSRVVGVVVGVGLVLTATLFWRAMPRDRSFDRSPRVDRDAADSGSPTVSPLERATTEEPGESGRTDADAPKPASTDKVFASDTDSETAATATTSSAAASAGEVPMAARQTDERPPAQVATELVVASQPAGAQVTVDGIGWGVTPATIRYLPAGAKHIRVSKEGYATVERVVSVVEGRRQRTEIQLQNER